MTISKKPYFNGNTKKDFVSKSRGGERGIAA